MLHAYVDSQQGQRRWFLHERAGAGRLANSESLSFLQQQFLVLAYDKYGTDKSDLPASAQHNL